MFVLAVLAADALSSSDAAAQSLRRSSFSPAPTSRNLEAIASRIKSERCHLLLVGDSIATHVAIDGRGTWVTGIWRTWRPDRWRGRFVPTVFHGASVNGTRVEDGGRGPAFDPACELVLGNVRPGRTIDPDLGSGWWGVPINAFETTGDLGDRRLFRVEMPAQVDGRDFWARYRTDPAWAAGPLRGTFLPILDPHSLTRYAVSGDGASPNPVDLENQRPSSGYALGGISVDFETTRSDAESSGVSLELRTDPAHLEIDGASIAMLGAVIERRDRETGLLLGSHAVGGDTTKSHLSEGEWLPVDDGGFYRRYDDQYLVEFIERVEWNTFVITLGTNDLKSYFRTPQETVGRLEAVIDRYRVAAAEARRRRPGILEPRFLVISPATAEDPELETAFAALDDAMGALAGGDVAVIHLHRLLVGELGIGSSHQPELLVDPAHPDEVGAMLKAELVWNEIEGVLEGTPAPNGPLHRVPGEYATIAAAAASAGPDDVVLVAPGLHEGGVLIGANDVVLRGSAGAASTILSAADQGGIVEILAADGDPVRLRGLTLEGGRSDYGAGVRTEDCPLVLDDVRFLDCEASVDGGAIFGGAATITLRDASIEDCRSGREGGGIAVDGGALIVRDAGFRGCESIGGGGAIAITDGSAELDDVTFDRNLGGEGGAVAIRTGSMSSRNSVFIDNIASTDGGAVHSRGPVSIQECLFEGNASGRDGGSILLDTATHSLVEQVSFIDSASGGRGGVMSARGGGSSDWRGTTVRTAVAEVAAGGWHLDCHDLSIATSRLEDLRATTCDVADVACGFLAIESTVMCPDALETCGGFDDVGGIEYPDRCDGVCEGDLNLDGERNGGDLGFLFAAWGRCPPASFCRADLDRDGLVTGEDLGLLLGVFGIPCSTP